MVKHVTINTLVHKTWGVHDIVMNYNLSNILSGYILTSDITSESSYLGGGRSVE